tara:strand:+ start:4679 stop:6079 length:1401 start_codon:yes stop_codon:yes gene_type:complete
MKNILLLLFVVLISACNQKQKPNIIWITCEDQSYYLFPFNGNSDVSLPNLEELAQESTVFTNMYSTYPVCAPARSSIISGMYPQSIGTHNMRAMHYDNYFRNEKKIGVRNKSEANLKFPRYSSKLAESVKTFPQILRENGYFTYNQTKGDYNYIINDSTWSLFNKKYEITQNDTPLFAVYNFDITHERRMWERDNQNLQINPKKIDIPPFFPDDSIVRRSYAVNYSNMIEMDKQIGQLIDKLKSKNLYENSFIFFFSDHGGPFPRHKRAIYETGTKTPFLVKFPKGKKEVVNNKQLLSFVDLAPTVLSIAGIKLPSEYQGYAFLGKYKNDLERNFLFTSSDRFDEHTDRIRAIRGKKYKYIRNYFPLNAHALDVNYRKQMPLMRHLTTLHLTGKLSDYQNNWFETPKLMEELYDLQNDPFELENLSEDKKYLNVKEELSYNLEKWMEEIDDLGGIPEKELYKLIGN